MFKTRKALLEENNSLLESVIMLSQEIEKMQKKLEQKETILKIASLSNEQILKIAKQYLASESYIRILTQLNGLNQVVRIMGNGSYVKQEWRSVFTGAGGGCSNKTTTNITENEFIELVKENMVYNPNKWEGYLDE